MKQPVRRLLSLITLLFFALTACLLVSCDRRAAEAKAAGNSTEREGITLIIDAGHGGADGGAVSLSGIKESEINLEIALKLEQVMAFLGVPTVMTRTTEALDYSASAHSIRDKKVEDQIRRLQMINGTKNAVLISVHQNIFPDGSPSGAQVLYADTTGSKELAEYLQKALIGALNTHNRRSAARVPKSVMLMNHIDCPAILIECGFLSNAAEERLLQTDTYRLKIAAVIGAGCLANRQNLNALYSGGTNEG
jgi:N-acetylmuramoyl-L-alanine amidase